jgi:hypothetical protein
MAKPATQPAATPAPSPEGLTLAARKAAAKVDLGKKGPYGDKALYGSMLKEDEGNGKPTEENDLESPVTWTFHGYVPANVGELSALLKAKPDMLLEMVQDRLMTKYRAQSWAEIRGGNVTADIDIIVNGVRTDGGRVALPVIEHMRNAGMVIEIRPRVKKIK